MSAVATAGAAAWVVPEILTAKPAAGATMSGTHGGTTGSTTGGAGGANPVTNPSSTTPAALTSSTAPGSGGAGGTLAMTGLNIQRDAEIGAALVAGGWAMHHWASRAPKPAAEGAGKVHEAGSSDELV